ncbi:hypothetical protein GF358_01005 [Candidatus Woesearchaeota archaeon]|nr:hypothetical protein [Candidatus Woesearchaeota archaeon]
MGGRKPGPEVRARNQKGGKKKKKIDSSSQQRIKKISKNELNAYEKLRRAIINFGFGAAIEVTNEVYNGNKREQVQSGFDFLTELVDGRAKLLSGVALVKSSKKAVHSHPDFYVDIRAFNNELYQHCARLALNSPFLPFEAQKALEDTLYASEVNDLRLHNLLESEDNLKVRDIKAVVLEIYVAELLRISFDNNAYRIFTREGYRYCVKRQKKDIYSGKKRELDIIVACEEKVFVDTLNSLKFTFDKVKGKINPKSIVSSSRPYQR